MFFFVGELAMQTNRIVSRNCVSKYLLQDLYTDVVFLQTGEINETGLLHFCSVSLVQKKM